MVDDSRDYHTERAKAELDMAKKASTPDAARAHLRLSSLHRDLVKPTRTHEPIARHRL